MPSNAQQQHYISKFLIKQWAECGEVGVVCMYHRDSAIVSASARTLHSATGLWSRDLERKWANPESQASDTINHLKESLGPNGDNYAAAPQVQQGVFLGIMAIGQSGQFHALYGI